MAIRHCSRSKPTMCSPASRNSVTCSRRCSPSPRNSPAYRRQRAARHALGSFVAMDPITLRNRLLVATGMWKEATGEPLPKMPPGDPADQLQNFELRLVDRLWESATPENAREI